ncbi:amino acid ABC transporter substrate-binding protein, PAAT family [Amycolatopsis marina]|uniref:Amino acid ABC transporter substrate-binding protein, PAAT family n=1 Tax=Amycolatopsis marina TaxID=490629 RepID=A0A1I0YG67_9PSEU|nr:glutamate ABC transporter substrate-binding protein [Amycolatopsis marina]SFB11857.1 amino acid ABC transporter substrate-binding protein, PAAT family [Amycolatopsis marina]
MTLFSSMRGPSARRPAHRVTTAIGAALVLLATAACTAEPQQTPPQDTASGAPSLLDLAPVASAEELGSSRTAAAIKRRGELLVGGEVNMPLLSQRNPTTGQTEGFDATLSKMLAKYIIGEPNTKIIKSTPETREALLRINTVDVVIRIYSITPARAEKVSFAGPYLTSGQAIATLKTEKNITAPEDLNGKTVLAVAGATSVQAVRDHAPDAEIKTFDTAPECIQALEDGGGDAYVHDLTLLAGFAFLNEKIQVVGDPFTSEPYGIGLRHGDEEFKQFINTWLKKIEDAGLWEQAWQQSLGTVVAGDPPEPPAIGSAPGS